MKNGRRNNDNDTERRTSASGSVTGQSIADGSNLRANDSISPGAIESSQGIYGATSSVNGSSKTEPSGNPAVTVPSGFYFTPDGNIERIPDGHYIHDGRLRKRRVRSNASDTADGNENRDRTEASEPEEFPSEIPLRTVGSGRGRKAKKITEAQQRLTMVSMLAVACSATFTSIALLTKHHHWSLESEEVKPLAEALNDAFATLPTKAYEAILAIIEKWVPWVNLVFVASAIIIPRIEASVKQYEASRYQPYTGSNERNARTENHHRHNEASFGFDVR